MPLLPPDQETDRASFDINSTRGKRKRKRIMKRINHEKKPKQQIKTTHSDKETDKRTRSSVFS